MTKKWSSTKSMDGQTKRQASKKNRRQRKREAIRALADKPQPDPNIIYGDKVK